MFVGFEHMEAGESVQRSKGHGVTVISQQFGLQAVFLLIIVFLVLIAVLLTIGVFRMMSGRGPERPGIGQEQPDAGAPRTGEVRPI